MKSPMLKRRLNPFLLATIVLVLSILAALSVLWQGNLSEIQQERNNLSETLDEKNQRISSLEQENNNLSQQINSLEGDLEQYLDENQLLRSQLNSANSTAENLRQENDRLQEENEELSGINETLGIICGNANNTIESDYYCQEYGHRYAGE